MQWWTYEQWCEERGLPCLVVPQGINGIDNRRYSEDGYLYVDGKKVDRYMRIQRYFGLDVLVRASETDNAKRFEGLRWKTLLHIQGLLAKKASLEEEIYDYLRCEIGPHAKRITGMYKGVLNQVDIAHNKHDGRRADGGPMPGWDKLDPLERMSLIPKSSKEGELVASWFMLREKLEKYWIKSANFASCLASILYYNHPDVRDQKCRPWNRPVTFSVNGRLYPVLLNGIQSKYMEYWPSPMSHPVIEI